MKRYLAAIFILCVFAYPVQSAVTTSDGAITIDFHEDTESGISNRWVLEFNVNTLDPSDPNYFESLSFAFYSPYVYHIPEEELPSSTEHVDTRPMLFNNEYNADSDYYYIHSITSGRLINLIPIVSELSESNFQIQPYKAVASSSDQYEQIYTSQSSDIPTPSGTTHIFYGMPIEDGEYIMGDVNFDITWYSPEDGISNQETLTLTGPIGFAPVPEPMSTALFAFGALVLTFSKKLKR